MLLTCDVSRSTFGTSLARTITSSETVPGSSVMSTPNTLRHREFDAAQVISLEAFLLRRDLVVPDRQVRNAVDAGCAAADRALRIGLHVPDNHIGALHHGSGIIGHSSLDRPSLRKRRARKSRDQ